MSSGKGMIIHLIVGLIKNISYKNKGHTPNWSEEVFVLNKIKNTVPLKI